MWSGRSWLVDALASFDWVRGGVGGTYGINHSNDDEELAGLA